jgi:hypothetical protein
LVVPEAGLKRRPVDDMIAGERTVEQPVADGLAMMAQDYGAEPVRTGL